jgi:predicted nucleic acid-binding protein
MTPWEEFAPGSTVFVDSAPIIYVLDGNPRFAPAFLELFRAIEAGRLKAVTSTVTLAEVLSGPLKAGDQVLAARYRAALEAGPGWSLMDLTADLAQSAAAVRSAHRLKLPDAIQVATALAAGAVCLVTADRDFAGVTEIRVHRPQV